MKKSKILVCFLIFVMIFSLFSVNAWGTVDSEIEFIENFDDTDVPGLDIVWAEEGDDFGVAPLYDENDNMYAITTWVTEKRPVKMTHTLASAVNEGMLYVSFDYKTTEQFNDSFFRLKSGDAEFQICGFRNTGKFGHFLEFSKWALNNDTAVTYSADTWYNVGVLFDLEDRYAYVYFGAEKSEPKLIETVEIPDSLGNITGVSFVQSFGDYTPAMWDNFYVNKVVPENIGDIQRRENIIFEKEIYRKYTNVLLSEDFQTNDVPNLGYTAWTDENALYGIKREKTGEGEYSLCSWVGEKYPTRLEYISDEPINKGVYYITFDLYSKDEVNDCYLRLKNSNQQYQVCGFRNDGYFGKFIDFSKWALNHDTEKEYVPNVWYKVSVVLDFDLRDVYIYFGEKSGAVSLLEKDKMPDEFSDFSEVIFVHSYGDYTEALWDNIKICRLNSETYEFVESDEGIEFEEDAKKAVAVNINTDRAGNIFYNAECLEFDIEYNNRSIVETDYNAWYELTYNSEVLMSEYKQLVLPQNGAKEYAVNIPVEKYGFYEFKIYNEDKTEILAETRFSNVHTAGDGVKNDKIGTTIHLTRVEDKSAAFEILKNGGFSVARGGQNDWSNIEKQKGVYEIDETNQEYYELAIDNGFENMTILKGSNELYASEFPTSNVDREGLVENPPQSDGLIEKFAKYCYETVVMYPQVKYFQIWNEWNNAPTFNLDSVTGAEYYAKVLKAGYAAVKKAGEDRGSEAVVVAMSPSGTKAEWISGVLNALNGEKCFDIVSIHPYTYTDGGENKESTYAPEEVCARHKTELGDVVTRVKAVQSVLEEYGYTDVPLWAGEFGFSSYICGEEKQAQYAVRMVALNDANNLLDKMLWYTFQNHTASTEKEQNFGMVRYHEDVLVPYEAKPVYLAMSNYNALMTDAKIIEKIADGESGVYIYKFLDRFGNTIYTAWTTDGMTEYEFKSNSKLLEFYDLYGNKRVMLNENGNVTLNLTEGITYIKEPKKYVKVVQSGEIITNISQMTDDEFNVMAYSDDNGSFDVILVQYNDDSLIDAVTYNSKEERNFRLHSETDEIRIFCWNNMHPVLDKLVIE